MALGPGEVEPQVIVPIVLGGLATVTLQAVRYRTTPFDALFEKWGAARNVDPDLLRAIARQESAYRPDVISGRVKSSAGAIGLMQVMPAIATAYGFAPNDMTVPDKAIDVATRLLRDDRRGLMSKGKYTLGHWIATYNAGLPRTLRLGEAAAQAGYVSSVITHHLWYTAARMIFGGKS